MQDRPSIAPGVNTEHLSTDQEPLTSQFAADPDMLELIGMFVRELPARVESLQQALARSDLATLMQVAHQLKGAGGGYGFPSITSSAAEVERLAKAKAEVDSLQDAVSDLISLCRRASSNPR